MGMLAVDQVDAPGGGFRLLKITGCHYLLLQLSECSTEQFAETNGPL